MDGGWGKTLTASGLLRDRPAWPGLGGGAHPVPVPAKKYLQKWYQQWAGAKDGWDWCRKKQAQAGAKGHDLGERPALA